LDMARQQINGVEHLLGRDTIHDLQFVLITEVRL
jgi:hypothetical protein